MAKLVINPTSASKKEIPIASRVISIGRDPSNDLVLSDSMVSRRHAILEQRDDIFVLRDNNSSNGTLVNGDKVDAEKTLRDGDLVAIGSSRILFQLEDGATLPTPSIRNVGLASEPAVVSGGDNNAVLDAKKTVRCPGCGTEARSDDRFCRACGAEVSTKKSVTCTACGKVVPLPAEFCGHCGHELPKKDRVPATRPNTRAELFGEPGVEANPSPPSVGARKPRAPKAAAAGARRDQERAGFGIRLVAAVVDSMILGIPLLVGFLLWGTFALDAAETGPPTESLFVISVGFPFLCIGYYVFFWGARGATPGKGLLGLTIETEDGESPIGFQRALLRVIGYFVSSMILGLGFVLIAFSEDKRGLHDRIAGTRVMRNL